MQLFSLLEADSEHHVTPDELCVALQSWLKIDKPAAAYKLLQHYSQLTSDWCAAEQQQSFQAALQLIRANPEPSAVQVAVDICMLAVVKLWPHSTSQVQKLVQALLAVGMHPKAYKVSRT